MDQHQPLLINFGVLNHNQNRLSPLRALPFQAEPKLRQYLQVLPRQLQHLYEILFNSQERPYQFKQVLPFEAKPSQSYSCNKQVTRKQKNFRCLECSLHEGSLICQSCFQDGRHNGHRYLVVSEEGSCDCGNNSFLKQEGFCKRHSSDSNRGQVNIAIEDRLKFRLYVNQIFVWILALWSKVHAKGGVFLLNHFILYLSHLNRGSRYYNLLTTQVLFEGNHPIILQLFQVTFADSLQKQLIKAFVGFLLQMMISQQFKEALLPVVIDLYNNSQVFDNPEIQKVLIVLLSDSKTITAVMSKATQTLDPSNRSFKPQKYYEHLMMLSFMKAEVAEMFLRPLLERTFLQSPLLKKMEQQCEKGNQTVVSIISENAQEEYGYYRVLALIVGSVASQALLRQMIANYHKMMGMYSFNKNKIVLIPHRILALLLFKYFKFDCLNVQLKELCEILSLSEGELRQFMIKYLKSLIGCLGEFSLDLVRNTYFYNYRNIYINEISQVVMLDYLALRLLATLFANYPQQLGSLPSVIYKDCYLEEQSHLQKESVDIQKDHFHRWNKLLAVLAEVAYSPKIQLINCIFLRQFSYIQHQAQQLLASIAKKIGPIGKEDLQHIKKNIFFNSCKEQWIAEVLAFKAESSKYVLKEKYLMEQSGEINFDLMVSLAHTGLNYMMKNEKPTRLYLSKSGYQLAGTLLNQNFTNSLLVSQLEFAKIYFDMEEMFQILPETLRITRTLALFAGSLETFAAVHDECKEVARNMWSVYQNFGNSQLAEKTKEMIEQLQQLLGGKEEEHRQKIDQERQRRKALLNAKKEKLMKERRIKENQQAFIEKNQLNCQVESETVDEEECLICKQKQKRWNLCYFSKIRLNNVLFDSQKFSEKHFMFCSCFHMVHFDCFRKQSANRKNIPCPLCQSASNIVIPQMRAFPNNPWLPQLYRLVLRKMEEITKPVEAMTIEGIIFFSYYALICLERQQSLSERELQLFRSIYNLMIYEHIHYPRQKSDIIEEFTTTNEFNIQKAPLNYLRKYLKNTIQFFQSSIKIRLTPNIYELSRLSSLTILSLSSIFPEPVCQKLVSFFAQVVSGSLTKQLPEQLLCKSRIIRLQSLPSSLQELLQLRDEKKCKKSVAHTNLLCILCGQLVCGDCGDLKLHAGKLHIGQTLFFNMQTGGLRYYSQEIELAIRSLFVDELGNFWHPKRESIGFHLDQKLYNDICRALQNGNLFYYLTHTFEGLKGNNISDII